MRNCVTWALAVALLAASAASATAQVGGHGGHESPAHPAGHVGSVSRAARVPLRLAVDGRKNPEQISDDLAYRHFVLVAAERTTQRLDRSAKRREQREARIRVIGLSSRDAAALTSALASVRERLDAIAAARDALAEDPPRERVDALRTREQAVLDGAVARIKAFLTPDGRARLEGYLRQVVKSRIVVYTD